MARKRKSVKNKKVPTLVKIISVAYYVGAAIVIILGVLFMAGAGIINLVLQKMPELATLSSSMFFAFGLLLAVLGLVYICIARGLWEGKNWARILVIVFCAIGVISGIMSLAADWFNLLLNLALGLYFYLNKKVRKAFA